jgi:hypothetical protein
MPLRVAWHVDALQELATLWLNTDDRAGVTSASQRIDLELAEQPLQKSRPAGDLLRSFRVVPLEVLFEYRPNEDLIQIVAVREVRPDRN